jgi:hypothetical protein
MRRLTVISTCLLLAAAAVAEDPQPDPIIMAVLIEDSSGILTVDDLSLHTVPSSMLNKLASESWQQTLGVPATRYVYALKDAEGNTRRTGELSIPARARTVAYADSGGILHHDEIAIDTPIAMLRVPFDESVVSIALTRESQTSSNPSKAQIRSAGAATQAIDLTPFLSRLKGRQL